MRPMRSQPPALDSPATATEIPLDGGSLDYLQRAESFHQASCHLFWILDFRFWIQCKPEYYRPLRVFIDATTIATISLHSLNNKLTRENSTVFDSMSNSSQYMVSSVSSSTIASLDRTSAFDFPRHAA